VSEPVAVPCNWFFLHFSRLLEGEGAFLDFLEIIVIVGIVVGRRDVGQKCGALPFLSELC
jgi:hypothetical protein